MAYNRTICDNLTEYPEEQVEVQKYASSLQIVNKVLQVWDTYNQNDLANVIWTFLFTNAVIYNLVLNINFSMSNTTTMQLLK